MTYFSQFVGVEYGNRCRIIMWIYIFFFFFGERGLHVIKIVAVFIFHNCIAKNDKNQVNGCFDF